MALVLSIVGVCLAVMALAWQLISFRMSHGTRVRVEISFGTEVDLSEPIVTVTAINLSAHAVHVMDVFLVQRDKPGHLLGSEPSSASTIPGIIEARDRGDAQFLVERMEEEGLSLTKPLFAFVWLATGKVVTSKPWNPRIAGID